MKSRWLIQYVFIFLAVHPTLFTTRFGWFGPLSWFCFGCQIIAFVCLVVYFARSQSGVDLKVIWFGGDHRVVINVISNYCIAFFAHSLISPVVQEMVDPSRRRTFRATWVANGICWVLTFFVPLFGFFCNPDAPSGSIFHALADQDAPEIIVGKAMMVAMAFIAAVYVIFFIGKSMSELIEPVAVNFRVPNWISGLSVCLFTLGLGLFGAVPRRIMSEIEYQCLLVIAYFLPPIYYWAQYRLRDKWAGIAVVVFIVGLGMSGWSLFILVQDLSAEA
jgi:amino acid permease